LILSGGTDIFRSGKVKRPFCAILHGIKRKMASNAEDEIVPVDFPGNVRRLTGKGYFLPPDISSGGHISGLRPIDE
jgi:hypothetical protein